MLIITGVILIVLSSFMILRSFHSRCDKTLDEYVDFIFLLRYIRDKISFSSMHLSKILQQDIELKCLSKNQFLDDARSCGLYQAFLKNEDKFNIDASTKKELREYFFGIGSDMLVVEIEKLTRVLVTLEDKYKIMSDDSAVKKKISSTVIICSALLIIIFII